MKNQEKIIQQHKELQEVKETLVNHQYSQEEQLQIKTNEIS